MPRVSGPSAPGARVAGAESGRRLLGVLLSFTERRPVWSIQELSESLGMSTSMVYRYVALLREVGLAEGTEDHRYRLTDLAGSLAGAARAGSAPLWAVAKPVLQRIRDAVDETALIARRSGWRVYTVDRVESHRPVRLQFEAGQAMELHAGALSRVLLAGMPVDERRRFLAQLPEGTGEPTALTPEGFDQVLADGYAESFEEIDEGIWGVAAPITGDGVVHGALGVAAPLFRTDAGRRAHIRSLVVDGAHEISELLERERLS